MKDIEPKETQNGDAQPAAQCTIANDNGHHDDELTNGSQNELEESAAEESEITLTDHLNKRLLSSFLDRINNQNPPMFSTSTTTTSNATENQNDDFVDAAQ